MARPDDSVRIDSVQGDFSIVIEQATTYEVVNDLTAPSEARFELGDEGSWQALKPELAIGTRFVVVVNNRPRLKGRLLARRMPVSAQSGATVQLTVRTVLADAMFTTCDPTINLRRASLRDAVLAAYKPLGVGEADFIFSAEAARNILTGKSGGAKGPADLQAIKEDAAKPAPPETVQAFVERHLNRFHLSHWDGPDGRIVVGTPDDAQAPVCQLRSRRGAAAQANNVLSCDRTEDFEEVPTGLWVFGAGGGRELAKRKVQWVEPDLTLVSVEPSLERSVMIVDDALKTQDQAEARARREMSIRSLQKNAWRMTVDGLSYWDGHDLIPYAPDTVADVHVDLDGVPPGPYLVFRTALRGSAEDGHTAELDLVGKGVWRL
jgi:prophage tail gpP-like protein